MSKNHAIIPMFYRRYPRDFQNEFSLGVATTAADAEQYAAEGYKEIPREVALAELSRHPENGEQLFVLVTVDGFEVEDRYMLARRIRHGAEKHNDLIG